MQTDTPPVSEAVRRAIALCDPDGHDDAAVALLEAFEDDDRPARGVEDLRGTLRTTVEGIDPEGLSGAAAVAAAVALFLGTSPAGGADDDATIREGVKAMYGDDPPAHVEDWLATTGVEL